MMMRMKVLNFEPWMGIPYLETTPSGSNNAWPIKIY